MKSGLHQDKGLLYKSLSQSCINHTHRISLPQFRKVLIHVTKKLIFYTEKVKLMQHAVQAEPCGAPFCFSAGVSTMKFLKRRGKDALPENIAPHAFTGHCAGMASKQPSSKA